MNMEEGSFRENQSNTQQVEEKIYHWYVNHQV